jgi:uncharacterized protein YdaT
MPWDASDAERHTKKAKTAKEKRAWSHIANKLLGEGYSEGEAIRIANGVIKKRKRGKKS